MIGIVVLVLALSQWPVLMIEVTVAAAAALNRKSVVVAVSQWLVLMIHKSVVVVLVVAAVLS